MARSGSRRTVVVLAVLAFFIGQAFFARPALASASSTPRHCQAELSGSTLCVTSIFNAHFGKQPPGTWVSSGLDDAVAGARGAGYVAGGRCSESGCSGLLGTSTDAGEHWHFSSTGRVMPAAVDFPSSSTGFVVGRPATPGISAGSTGLSPCAYGGGPVPPCTVLLRTDDGGQAWSPSGHGLGQIWAMAFVSATTGFLAVTHCRAMARDYEGFPPGGCPGEIEATSNGGGSWYRALSTPEPVLALAATGGYVWAIEADFAALAAHPVSPGWLRALRSDDDGAAWSSEGTLKGTELPALPDSDLDVQLSLVSASVAAMTLFSSSTCAMHGCGLDNLLTTRDGGHSWSIAHLPGGAGVGCGQHVDGLGVAPGSRIVVGTGFSGQCPAYPSGVAVSTNGGKTWVPVQTFNFGPFPSTVAFATALVGWGVEDGTVLRTTDGGSNWRQVWPAPSPTEGVDFLTPGFGYGLGDQSDEGAVLVTGDAGQSWHQVASLGQDLVELDFTSASTGWALAFDKPLGAGRAGLSVTYDGGRSWAAVPLPNWAAMDIAQLEGDQPGAELSLLHASSARSAELVVPPPVPPFGARAQPGAVLSTSDAGHDWARTALPDWAVGIATAGFADRSNGWVIAGDVPGGPAVLESSSGGARNWSVVGDVPSVLSSGPGAAYIDAVVGYGLDMVSARQGWIWLFRFGDAVGRPEALARSTGLLKTSDGGRTWSRFRIPGYDIVSPFDGTGWPVQLGPVCVQFLPGHPDVGWALTSAAGAGGGYFGDGTTLWHTTDGGKDWTASGY
jgi:photosystem II stability/assembly factor-like uncharacterized protein